MVVHRCVERESSYPFQGPIRSVLAVGYRRTATPWKTRATRELGGLEVSFSSVDVDSLTGNEPCIVGAKKRTEGRDFIGLSHAADWYLRYSGIWTRLLPTFANCIDCPWDYAVDQDAAGR